MCSNADYMAVDQPLHTPPQQQPGAANAWRTEPDDIRLFDILRALWARKYLIASLSFVMAALGVAASYLVRPLFRAEILVLPVMGQESPLAGLAAQFGGLAQISGLNPRGNGTGVAIATLTSRSLTETFIQDYNLLPVLFADAWDPTNKRWRSSDAAPTTWDAYRLLQASVRRVVDDRKTGLVTLTIEWRDPQAAADWANELVRRANSKLQQENIAESQKTIAYLEQQLSKANAIEIRQALYSIIELETKNIAVAHAREQFAFRVIDPAITPQKKSKPNRLLFLMLGAALGFMGSAAFVLAAGSARRREL